MGLTQHWDEWMKRCSLLLEQWNPSPAWPRANPTPVFIAWKEQARLLPAELKYMGWCKNLPYRSRSALTLAGAAQLPIQMLPCAPLSQAGPSLACPSLLGMSFASNTEGSPSAYSKQHPTKYRQAHVDRYKAPTRCNFFTFVAFKCKINIRKVYRR